MHRAMRASATVALLASVLAATPTTAQAVLIAGAFERDPSVVVRHAAPRDASTILAQLELLPPVVARLGEVELRSPSRRLAVAGFHQGATRSLELEPVGDVVEGLQAPTTRGERAPVAILPSRGRSAPATSAVDLAVLDGEALVSPVDGTVVGVSEYSLYGKVRDWLVEVRPSADPDVIVRIFHLEDPQVEVGQELLAGRTPLATAARLLPFASQVDRLTTRPLPHVHIQADAH